MMENSGWETLIHNFFLKDAAFLDNLYLELFITIIHS